MTYNNNIDVEVFSEIGKLEGVILHTPGKEIENMTPGNAERALYSDILNLNVCSKEYMQFSGVLEKVSKTFQVRDLLSDILSDDEVKRRLIGKLVRNENLIDTKDQLLSMNNIDLSRSLIEGVIMTKNNLTKYLSKDRYSLDPVHNFFFTRDASISVNHKVLIAKMASTVRARESFIMEAIFNNHPIFNTTTVNPLAEADNSDEIRIEGGDILIARKDIMLIGIGARTNSQGVDFILEKLRQNQRNRDIIVQELPLKPESFIHLDMVFTLVDKDKCVVYDPIITKPNKYQTVHIQVRDGEVKKISNEDNMLVALKKLGMDLDPISCGGTKDRWVQDREQWHSGANFFAFAPGKIVGYARNHNTIEELYKKGFEVIKANEIINGSKNVDDYNKCVVVIEGSELARGGGGARCMTMPVRRQQVNW
jgi:arginine deiminase